MMNVHKSEKTIHDILGKLSVISLNIEILENDNLPENIKKAAFVRIKAALDEAVITLQSEKNT